MNKKVNGSSRFPKFPYFRELGRSGKGRRGKEKPYYRPDSLVKFWERAVTPSSLPCKRAFTPKCQPSTDFVLLTKVSDDSRFRFQLSEENVGFFSVRLNFSPFMYVLWKYPAKSSVCSATVSSKLTWSNDLPMSSITKLKHGSTCSGGPRLTQESCLGSKRSLGSFRTVLSPSSPIFLLKL